MAYDRNFLLTFEALFQDVGKGRLSLRGVAVMTVLAVWTVSNIGGSGEHLALLLLVLQYTGQRSNRDGFDGFGGYLETPKRVPKQTGKKHQVLQNSKNLPFCYPIRFDLGGSSWGWCRWVGVIFPFFLRIFRF